MTLTLTKQTSIESLGIEAYNSGLGCFPQLDETLQEIIAQQPENREELMRNWARAWQLAHFARTLDCGS